MITTVQILKPLRKKDPNVLDSMKRYILPEKWRSLMVTLGGLIDASNDTAFKAQNLDECSADQVVASTFYVEIKETIQERKYSLKCSVLMIKRVLYGRMSANLRLRKQCSRISNCQK
jgi:hypothetical protein